MCRIPAFRWIEDAHARRTAGLLLFLWLLGSCDFLFTVWAQRYTPLQEVNPWASLLLRGHQFASLGLGKCVLTLFGTIVFWLSRDRRLTRLGLWGLVLLHVALMVRWSNYTAKVLADGRVEADGQARDVTYMPPLRPLPDFAADKPDEPDAPVPPRAAPAHAELHRLAMASPRRGGLPE